MRDWAKALKLQLRIRMHAKAVTCVEKYDVGFRIATLLHKTRNQNLGPTSGRGSAVVAVCGDNL
jgi:hypothetical protein